MWIKNGVKGLTITRNSVPFNVPNMIIYSETLCTKTKVVEARRM